MQSLEILRQFDAYNTWANGEFLRYFQTAANSADKAVRVFNHLLWAEEIWLRRMIENLDTTGFDFHAGETVEDCVQMCSKTRKIYAEFFADLTEEKLETVFHYKNSKGLAFTNTYREALTHVFFHSQYHRGQVAQAIRASGDAPPYTDFIQFLRIG